MREKTGKVLSEHRLVKDFHEYREARKFEQEELLLQFEGQQRELGYK